MSDIPEPDGQYEEVYEGLSHHKCLDCITIGEWDAASNAVRQTPAGDDQREALDALRAKCAEGNWFIPNTQAQIEILLAVVAARPSAPTINGLGVQDWFDIAVAKEQVNDALYTRIAELEASAPTITTEQVRHASIRAKILPGTLVKALDTLGIEVTP